MLESTTKERVIERNKSPYRLLNLAKQETRRKPRMPGIGGQIRRQKLRKPKKARKLVKNS
jgi:hypothetical protein